MASDRVPLTNTGGFAPPTNQGEVMQDNQTTLAKLIELRDKETPEQRKAFLEAEQRYMEHLEELQLELHIAQRYMK